MNNLYNSVKCVMLGVRRTSACRDKILQRRINLKCTALTALLCIAKWNSEKPPSSLIVFKTPRMKSGEKNTKIHLCKWSIPLENTVVVK